MHKDTKVAKLERVDLREIWRNEASDFTPWLAQEDNLKLLGDVLGMELELDSAEKWVGPFRADILARDTSEGHWVLVENQLERTDHIHLGQLITYAAGLKAVTIVWIAERFTEEHRAALDWLNEVTNDDINFFGLEIELWKIEGSPSAAKFNAVCKPNNWTKTGHGPRTSEISKLQALQLQFWTEFREYLLVNSSSIKFPKPLPQSWMQMGIGRFGFNMCSAVNTRDKWLKAEVNILGADPKDAYRALLSDRESIERESGVSFDWEELPGKLSSRVVLYREGFDLYDSKSWDAHFKWLREHLETIHSVFSKRIKNLDLSSLEETR